uniref:4-nitrophenylphosphatase n=1 Tax=Zeugodacus cucurbitae TaxID=28588 RepID=A0A0A1X7Y0_ZEUCU
MTAHKVPHILKLSAQEQQEFVNSFDVVMCDCDGVMWMIASPLPRTGEAVCALKVDGKQVLFVSNNSVRTDEDYVKKFKGIGVKDFQANDIMHPVKAMLYYMKKHNIKQPVFSLCSAPGNETLRDGGIDVRTLVPKEEITPATLEKITRPEEKMGAVLYDIKLDLSYAQIVAATRYLADKDCQFLAGGTDWLLPLTGEVTVPGFCDFLETIKRFTQREPTIVCKPALLLGDILKDVYKLVDPKRCLFIGDSLTHDIRFALGCGFQSLLVLSGSTPVEEMWEANAEDQPHYYADSIADFIELYDNISKTV